MSAMDESKTDPERIAALVDGKLGAAEREQLLRELSASPDGVELLADVAAVLDGAGGAPAVQIRPVPARATRWPRYAIGGAIAAVLAFVILMPRGRNANESVDGFLAIVASAPRPSDAGWSTAPWPLVRGEGAAVTADGRAVRVGARIVDLDVALRSADSSVAGIAGEIAAELDAVPGSAPIASRYRAVATDRRSGAERPAMSDSYRAAATIVGAAGASRGALLETTRLAALAHDVAFYTSAINSRALDLLANDTPALSAEERATLTRIRAGSDAVSAADWDALARGLGEALAVAAR